MQTRSLSALEAVINTAVGFAVSLALTFALLPFFGYDVTTPHAWGITTVYTAASVLRGYFVRRVFNRMRQP